MKNVLCNKCHHWFEAKHRECLNCGAARPEYNRGLVSARWASALNAKAAHAVADDTF